MSGHCSLSRCERKPQRALPSDIMAYHRGKRKTCAIKQLVISAAAGLKMQFLHCAFVSAVLKWNKPGWARPGWASPQSLQVACRGAGSAGSWPLSGHNCRKRPWRVLEEAASASAWLSLTAKSKPEAWSRAGLHEDVSSRAEDVSHLWPACSEDSYLF